MNLTYVMLRKSHGQSIEGDDSVDRLVEIRTVSKHMAFLNRRSFIKIPFSFLPAFPISKGDNLLRKESVSGEANSFL